MGLCERLGALGPAARQVIATQEGRNLAAALGLSPAQLMQRVNTGADALDRLCRGAPGAAGPMAALEAMMNGGGLGMNANTSTPANGQVYEGCRVVMNPDGTARVQCPESPAGGCGCGNCPPATACVANANCLPSEPTFAPCTVESVCAAYEFAPFSASWSGAPVAIVPPALEPAKLFQRTTATRYMLTILPIGAASQACLDAIQVSNSVAGIVAPAALAYQCARLRQDPTGVWVWAWDTAKWIFGQKLTITAERCTCPPGAMCCCQLYNGPIRVIVDTVADFTSASTTIVTASFTRIGCGAVQCQPCAPGLICNLTPLATTYTDAAGAAVSPHSYLWGGGLPPAEPTLSYAGLFGPP